MQLMQHIAVFVGAFALDFVWAKYIFATSQRQKHKATFFAGALSLVSAIVTVLYVNDPYLVPAFVLGAMAGTWAGT